MTHIPSVINSRQHHRLSIREAVLIKTSKPDRVCEKRKEESPDVMDIRETLTLDEPEDLRKWFQENHNTKIEIWLIFHKRESGLQTLTIAQAVEEALCFGWIQSRLKPLEAGKFAVRFSPRRIGSYWSLPNLKRVRRLIAQGRMTQAGMAVLPPDFV